MRELLEYIVKAIVDAPDKVVITEEDQKRVLPLLELLRRKRIGNKDG
jgi:predicted RNA-binding protein YlqC (UPF0109 family)